MYLFDSFVKNIFELIYFMVSIPKLDKLKSLVKWNFSFLKFIYF